MRLSISTQRQPASCSDADLLLGVAAHKPDSLQELYDRYFPVAYSLAVRMLGESAPAEECAQEVFVELWAAPHTCNPDRGEFCAWLLSAVHQTAHRRQQMIRLGDNQQQGRTPEHEPATVGASGPALRMLTREHESARAVMARLLPAERQVLELAYFDGLTTAQIAVTSCQSRDVVANLIRVAMGKLSASRVSDKRSAQDSSKRSNRR